MAVASKEPVAGPEVAAVDDDSHRLGDGSDLCVGHPATVGRRSDASGPHLIVAGAPTGDPVMAIRYDCRS
jgi:hypothetical protein